MTAQRSAESTSASTPPRALIRTFWLLHRAAYRITGGRFGLQAPAAGQRFGTMRLTTVGRRSGTSRLAIIGYFQDGENLVSLAMNGWGVSEPAWWLNLQANPETIVELGDGPRAVRARAATGAERDRLWERFAEFPGWGDVDALATRRPAETAVVVFEPVCAAPAGESRSAVAGQEPTVGPMVESRSAGEGQRRRRLGIRHLWIVPGLALAVAGNMQAQGLGIGILALVAFGIAPDLPRLLGIGQPRTPGHMAARVIRLHNLAHHPLPPLALIALTAVGVLPGVVQVAALIWLGHIVIGLGIGDRQRRPDGSLGPISPFLGARRPAPGPAVPRQAS
jgi:deazaflavin-dependent oxidoreductase (nitroreductase family)